MLFRQERNKIRDVENESRIKTLETDHANEGHAFRPERHWWRSRFIRYIDTRPNGDALRKCILNGPYIPTTVVVQAVAATDDSLAVPEHTTVETPMNMSPENKDHFESEKELRKCRKLLKGYSKPEWLRFVTIVKQQLKLDEVSYHKLFDILKQYQKEVNKLRAQRLARNANPLVLVATAQVNQDPYYQTSKSHKSYAPSSKPSIPTRSHTTTRSKGKEMAKLITPLSELAFEEDNDPEQAQRDKDITSSNSKNKNVDTTLRYKNDNQSGQFRNQRTMNVVGARENLGNTNKEIDEQELEAHNSYMAKIQEVPTAYPESDDECVALANIIANLKLDVDENKKIQKQLKKANTTLAQELKECKTILAKTSKTLRESNSVRDSCLVALQNKQTEFEKYTAFNDRLKLKAYEASVVKEKHDELIKQSLLTKSHYEGLVKQKTKVIMDLKLKEEHDKMLSLENQLKFLNEIVYKKNQSIQTIHMMAPKVPTYNGRPTFANLRYLKQAQSKIPCLYAFPYYQSTHANRLIPDEEETLALERGSQSKLNKDSTQNDSFIFFHELKQEVHVDLKYVESFEKEMDELESDKADSQTCMI
nr:Gag-Pol polyprotein [Tanacetum cinerariifolium]